MKEYFSHDYVSREDEKIKRLLYAHNMTGYGIYWALVEMLYQNEGYCLFECERIAFDLHTQSDVIESVICDFELFKINGNKFYSESVLRRLSLRLEKSEKARESAFQRWNANAMRTQSEGNAIKEKKSKEKKIVRKNTNLPISERTEHFVESLKEFKDIYSKDMLNAFYRYWSEKTQDGSKMKFEMEKTWELSKRLATWKSRQK